MPLKNWLVTCHLLSPLCGDAPMVDSLMEYELAMRLGYKNSRKLTRNTPLSEIQKPPIPVAKRTLCGFDIYCSSAPILGTVFAEYSENMAKRFDTDTCALLLNKKSSGKKLLTSSGPYKARFVPKRVRVIDTIKWFARGDRKEMNKLLRKVIALGTGRAYGYGQVDRWEYEEQEADNSIFAMHQGKKVVMKTLPIQAAKGATGYKHSYGGAFPPYWHPETFMEVAIPC